MKIGTLRLVGLVTSAVTPALAWSTPAPGTLTYGPLSATTSVPTLSGVMLIALAALLAVAALRVFRKQSDRHLSILVVGLSLTALITAGAGVKLTSDAVAAVLEIPLDQEAGDTVAISPSDCNVYLNTTPIPQRVQAIDFGDCSSKPIDPSDFTDAPDFIEDPDWVEDLSRLLEEVHCTEGLVLAPFSGTISDRDDFEEYIRSLCYLNCAGACMIEEPEHCDSPDCES